MMRGICLSYNVSSAAVCRQTRTCLPDHRIFDHHLLESVCTEIIHRNIYTAQGDIQLVLNIWSNQNKNLIFRDFTLTVVSENTVRSVANQFVRCVVM